MLFSDSEPSSSKILVALDAASAGIDTLAAAADLAAQLQAELQGLFVEDLNLLRLASLPFAQEISLTPPVVRPLNLAALEQTLRDVASRVRQSLSEHAERRQVPWSFAVTRGHLVRLPAEILEAADVLVLGCPVRHSPNKSPKGESPSVTGPLLVLYDGSLGSEHALTAGLDLARDQQYDIVFMLSGDVPAEALLERLVTGAYAQGRHLAVALLRINSSQELIAAIRAQRGRLVLLGRDASLLDDTTLESLVNVAGCPVALVR